jgi:hypothetical protein
METEKKALFTGIALIFVHFFLDDKSAKIIGTIGFALLVLDAIALSVPPMRGPRDYDL